MSKKEPVYFLYDIEISLSKIFRYTENIGFNEFITDEKTKDAVERNFEIIGEAVKNLSEDFRKLYPHIPFKQIAGMRDKLIHDYFGVDYEIIWKTIKDKLPEFNTEIKNLLMNILKKAPIRCFLTIFNLCFICNFCSLLRIKSLVY